MYVLIYRKADGTIRNITNCDKYFKRGTTLKKIKESIPAFNEHNPDCWAELRKVSKMDEEFLRVLIPDDVELLTDSILHATSDYVKGGKYIYEFVKCDNHTFPVLNIMKLLTKGEYRLAELRHDKGKLPFAWCYASDLLDKLGVSKLAMNKMLAIAESLAWGWYEKGDKEE